ncbi:MAG TPA: hypothetical protein VG326_08980 [Tepidisphaeraceae bacterium]|jgi:L-arabinokinase|nr:hypothetical protein [Tepidisphaeraceae bacterium]
MFTDHAQTLLAMAPIPALLARTRADSAAGFDVSRPVRLSRAPGRLDVMGGIADYTGSLVCELTLDVAAAVALQERADRRLSVVSFNLLDEGKPGAFSISLDELATHSAPTLSRLLDDPACKWAAYIVGCLFVLHQRRFIDLLDPAVGGLNLALLSAVPSGAGVGSSAAIEVAAMMNLRDHFDLLKPAAGRSLRIAHASALNPMMLAELCQAAENQIVGAPSGIMDQATSCWGESGTLLRMVCQPHELQPPLAIPPGVRFVGIDSRVRHDVAGAAYGRTRRAAYIAHAMIVDKMRDIGQAAGRRMVRDPLNGYLANLDLDHYKRIFRPFLPERIAARQFIAGRDRPIDAAPQLDPDAEYEVRSAADHHVIEAHRVKHFASLLEEASAAPDAGKKGFALDRAGHLMYASHQSYSHDAMLGSPECDLLVKLVRAAERAGLYGARITGGGSGGTVAVLADVGDRADAALGKIMKAYENETGHGPQLLAGSSPGAWHVGTATAPLAK